MKNLLFFMLFLSILEMDAQTISRESISNSGDIYTNIQAGELSWTLGEISVETYLADTLKLTQGFQQVYLTIVPVFTQNNHDLKIYPNPASDFVILENINPQVSKFQLTDALGKVLLVDMVSTKTTQFGVEFLATGTYFITLLNKNNTVVSIHKIIKSIN